MENSMAVTTATDARRIGGVPISLKWLSFYVLNPDKDGREVGDWVRATVLLPTVRSQVVDYARTYLTAC